MPKPEERARQEIDRLLAAAGWAVQDLGSANLAAAQGVALREFQLLPGHGFADYLLYVNGKACGVIEARRCSPRTPNAARRSWNLQRVKANLKRYVSGVLADAVDGRLLPGAGKWPIATVDEVGDVLLGRQRAPQYLTGRWPLRYLRVANIKDDRIAFDDLEEMDFDDAHFAKYRLAIGDILVSEGQSPELLGQSAIFRGFDEPLCFQKTLHRFRAPPGVTTAEFAQIVFRSHVLSGVFRKLHLRGRTGWGARLST